MVISFLTKQLFPNRFWRTPSAMRTSDSFSQLPLEAFQSYFTEPQADLSVNSVIKVWERIKKRGNEKSKLPSLQPAFPWKKKKKKQTFVAPAGDCNKIHKPATIATHLAMASTLLNRLLTPRSPPTTEMPRTTGRGASLSGLRPPQGPVNCPSRPLTGTGPAGGTALPSWWWERAIASNTYGPWQNNNPSDNNRYARKLQLPTNRSNYQNLLLAPPAQVFIK